MERPHNTGRLRAAEFTGVPFLSQSILLKQDLWLLRPLVIEAYFSVMQWKRFKMHLMCIRHLK